MTIAAGSFLLEDVSLTARPGECHIIVGPTGSGKSLLLESVIGFRQPVSGEVVLDGCIINELPVEKRAISYVPQAPSLFPHLSVEDNIFYGVKLQKGGSRRKELGYELALALGIDHLLQRSTVNLSGGEQQRVALVRALAPGNNVLLLDEPLSALHESLKKELWFLLRELQARYDLTILMVTHDLEEAFFLGDTISLFIDGRIQQTGPQREIYSRPATVEAARFLGVRNLFGSEVVAREKKGVSIYCQELGREFFIPGTANPQDDRFARGDRVIAGIRSEEVMILRPGYSRQDQDNTIDGTIINIFAKGSSHTIFFAPEGLKQNIEIEIPNYALTKLQISKGEQRTISLRGENIFLLPR